MMGNLVRGCWYRGDYLMEHAPVRTIVHDGDASNIQIRETVGNRVDWEAVDTGDNPKDNTQPDFNPVTYYQVLVLPKHYHRIPSVGLSEEELCRALLPESIRIPREVWEPIARRDEELRKIDYPKQFRRAFITQLVNESPREEGIKILNRYGITQHEIDNIFRGGANG